ncbi:MAG TPA: hypothetical protein VEP46_00995, partial [Vicinamibacterales bacterium]|nr:hypothetical protein [Vicinamibacterales bacterium]
SNRSPTPNYVAISSQMSVGQDRIVGFAQVTWARNCIGGLNPSTVLMITRTLSTVARSNATAALPNGFAGVPPALITELMDKNLGRNGGVNYGPVLVPVLAR